MTLDKRLLLRTLSAAMLSLALLALTGCGKTYSHDEFTQLVMNKSEAEVRNALGEPAWINDGKPATWIYHRKTFDAKKETDDKVSLTFGPDAASGHDKVVDVRFD